MEHHNEHKLLIAFVRENSESSVWWPAIVGDSYAEVIQSFAPGEGKGRATFTRGWAQDELCHSDSCTKLARLMNHKMHPKNQRMLPIKIMHQCIVEGMESILIKDFYEFIGDKELKRNACDNEGCSIAIDQALAWVVGEDFDVSHSAILSSPGGAYYSVDGPLSPHSSTDQVSQEKSASESMVSNVLQTKPSAKDSVDNDCKMPASNASYEESACSSPATRSASKKNTNAAVAASNVVNEENNYNTPSTRYSSKVTNAPVAVAAYQTRSGVSNTSLSSHPAGKKVTPSKEKISSSKRRGTKNTMRDIKKNDKWEKALEILEHKHGWEVRPGPGIYKKYFIPAELAKESTEDIKKKYKHGKDYFTDELDVMHIARKRYGWTGPNVSIPINGEWPTVLGIIKWKLDLIWKGNNMRIKRKDTDMNASEIKATLKKNKDYFTDEDGLKDFAYTEYRWRGPPGKEHVPIEHMNRTRKRGADSMVSHTSKSENRKKPSKTRKSILNGNKQDIIMDAVSQDSNSEESEKPSSAETTPAKAIEAVLNGKEQDIMDAGSPDSKSEESKKPPSAETTPAKAIEAVLNGKEQDIMDAGSQDSKSEESEKPSSAETTPAKAIESILRCKEQDIMVDAGSPDSNSEEIEKPSSAETTLAKAIESILIGEEQDIMDAGSQDSNSEESEKPPSAETTLAKAIEAVLIGEEQDIMDAVSQDSNSEESEKPPSAETTPAKASTNIADNEGKDSEDVRALTPVSKEAAWPNVLSKIEWNLNLIWKKPMWVKREHMDKKASDIEATLKKNEDYFKDEDGLKDFAYHHYRWRGPPGKEHVPFERGTRRRKCSMDRQEVLNPAAKKTKNVADAINKSKPSSLNFATGNSKSEVVKAKNNSPKATTKAGPGRKASAQKTKRKGSPIRPGCSKIRQLSLKATKNISSKISSQLSKHEKKQTQSSVGESSKARDSMTSGEDHNSAILTLKERLVRCSNNMDASFAPTSMLFDGDSSTSAVTDVKNKISSFCRGCLDFEDKRSSGESSFLYICGRPGTGKVRAEHTKDPCYELIQF